MERLLFVFRKQWHKSPVFVCVLCLSWLASLLPIWIGRYVPLLDYPAHLANLYIFRHLNDPALGFSQYYETNLAPLPYWVQYGIEYGLSIFVGEELAQKLFLSLAIGLLPWTVALYARALGRDPWLLVLAIPLAWNMNVANGFLAYVGGLPLLFVALWSLAKYSEQPSVSRALVATLLGVLLYFSHILLWGTLLCAGGLTALVCCRPFAIRRVLVALCPLVPTTLLGLWAQLYGDADKTRVTVRGAGLHDIQGVWSSVAQNLDMLRGWTMNTLPETRDENGYQLLWLAAWLVLLIVGFRSEARTPTEKIQTVPLGSRLLGRAEVGFACAVGLFFSLPRSLLRPFYWYAVNRRLAVVVALFAILLIRGSLFSSALRRGILLGVMVLSIVYTVDVSAHYYRVNQRLAAFDALIAQVPRGKQVLPLMSQFGDPDCAVNCFNQWGSYLQIRQGGYMIPYFPIEFPLRRKQVPTPTPIPWDHPQSFRFREHARGWDYFLIHGPVLPSFFAGSEDAVRLVGQRGDFTLYEKRAGLP